MYVYVRAADTPSLDIYLAGMEASFVENNQALSIYKTTFMFGVE